MRSSLGLYAGNSKKKVCAKCHSACAAWAVLLVVWPSFWLASVPTSIVLLVWGTPLSEKSAGVIWTPCDSSRALLRTMVQLVGSSYEKPTCTGSSMYSMLT